MSLYWTPKQIEEYQAKLEAQKKSANTKSIHRAKTQVRDDGATNPPTPPARAREDSSVPYTSSDVSSVPVLGYQGKRTKTEEKYDREILGGKGRFEAVSLYLPGGGRYTPDFMTIEGGIITFHEVKGSYRLQSQGRAWTAFKEAQMAFPMWRFVWATWTGKEWKQKVFDSSAIGGREE